MNIIATPGKSRVVVLETGVRESETEEGGEGGEGAKPSIKTILNLEQSATIC